MKLGIAIASGTFKGVFGHGVLSALEENSIKADVYACASSSVLSGSLAAIGKSGEVGVSYWIDVANQSSELDMSEVVLYSIHKYAPLIKSTLFSLNSPRLLLAVSEVLNQEAAEITQGTGAGKLGRKLLINALRKDNSWVKANLRKTIYDTHSKFEFKLDTENYDEVAYASTRMMHAWKKPAWIGTVPFVDASYTCSCPALELAELGCQNMIVISAEPGPVYNDIFQTVKLDQDSLSSSNTNFICPDYDLKTIGVDFTEATEEGMQKAYQHGYEKGLSLINKIAI